MNHDSKNNRFQFQIIDLLALLLIGSVFAAAIKFSVHYLPPIYEMPPPLGQGNEGQNWLGQEGSLDVWLMLLAVTYCVKRIILVHCKRRLAAVELFSLFAIPTLPYIWFICETDWFNPFLYRVFCWVGGPIMFWFVPVVSFLVDLPSCGTPKSLKRYLIRSAIEILVAIPIWAFVWTYFSFFILGWGWI